MKALAKTKSEPGIWLVDVDKPDIGPNDVLVKIRKTAICGTDLHIYLWDEWAQNTIPVPMTVGHEFMGEIVKLGSEVEGFSVGDRVSGEGHITCGHCRNCRAGVRHLCRNTQGLGVNVPGAFAEYLKFPARNLFRLEPEISDDIASILDPLGNATHCALSFDMVGEDILITGAGPIGIMAVVIAKHVGARHVVITDVNPYRLNLAKSVGATKVVNVATESLDDVKKELQIHEGFDVGLEMSGNPKAFSDMLQHMNHGGRVALLGLLPKQTQINWDHVIFKGLLLKGIYGREMFETWYKMASMLRSGLNVSKVITHHFPIDDYDEAFKTLASGHSGKVILNWE